MKLCTLGFLFVYSIQCVAADFHKLANSQNVTLSAMIKDSDSSVLIVGYVGNSISRGVILRADVFGDTIWSKTFEDSLSVQFLAATLSFDSTRILVAGSLEDTTGHYVGLIIEMDRDGNIQWQKKYSFGLGNYSFKDISIINNSSFAISTDVYPGFGYLILFDSSGYSYRGMGGGNLYDYAAPIVLTDGNLFISGTSYNSFDHTAMNFGIKTDTSLTVSQWSKVYNGFTTNDDGNAGKKGVALNDGGFIFSNLCRTQFSMRYTVYRVDSTGQVVWSVEGGPYFAKFSNGDYLFSNNNYYYYSIFVRMDSSVSTFTNYRSVDWCTGMSSFNGRILGIGGNVFFGFDSLNCNMTNIGSASDSSYNYPVDPYPFNGSFGFHFTTANTNMHPAAGISFYQDCTTILVEEDALPELNIYPNPSQGLFKIEIGKNSDPISSIYISDILGRTRITRNINFEGSDDLQEFDLTGFAKGIYFIEFSNSHSRSFRKIILN